MAIVLSHLYTAEALYRLDGIEVNVKGIRWEATEWIHLAWDWETWRDFVKTRMSLKDARNLGNFLVRSGIISYSIMSVLWGVV